MLVALLLLLVGVGIATTPIGAQEVSEAEPLPGRRRVDPDAGVYWLASDDYASLAPGWVVIYMGPFDSSDAAIATCHELGHYDRNSCYAAPLSQNPADRDNRVFP